MSLVKTGSRLLSRLVTAAGILVVVGCGGSGGGDNVARFPASGKVMLEGAPVEGAVVAFSREDGQATAVAMTDEMGQFNLNVPPGKRGVPVGKYNVTVRKSSVVAERKEPTTFADMERDHKAGLTSQPAPPPKLEVPARYGDPTTSQIKEEVKAAGKNEFTIELKG